MELLTINDVYERLKKYIEVVPRRKVSTEEHIKAFIEDHDVPIVIKGFSSRVSHKSDKGLVITNICSYELAKKAWKDMLKKAEHIYVEKQIYGREFFISFKRDPLYGVVFSFGYGGKDVEIYKDVFYGLLPVKEKELVSLMKSTKLGRAIVDSSLRKPAPKVIEIYDVINGLKRFYEKEGFIEMELNPLIFNDKGFVAVDFKATRINI